MSAQGYLGEIRTFGFNFAPQGFALCNGQILAISQNTALFSLLGTYYGGNGQTTFQLPDLRGRVALHQGQGFGLQNYQIGETGGAESVTLTISQMPTHSHAFVTNDTKASLKEPATGVYLGRSNDIGTTGASPAIYVPAGTNAAPITLAPTTIGTQGGSTPHENRPPFLTVSKCIALQGIYPARN